MRYSPETIDELVMLAESYSWKVLEASQERLCLMMPAEKVRWQGISGDLYLEYDFSERKISVSEGGNFYERNLHETDKRSLKNAIAVYPLNCCKVVRGKGQKPFEFKPAPLKTPNFIPCLKWSYSEESMASKALAEIAKAPLKAKNQKKPIRCYECPKCGLWHLTSKPALT